MNNMLPLELLLVFGAAKFLSELFEKLGQPGLVGEILAGVLLGPAVLNWIHPNAVLDALSELGILFLLFRVGLEVKPSELFKVGKVALLVAIAGVVLPLVAGWGLLVYWGKGNVESLFVGAAAVATSVGITAQVLASKGLLDERASKVILAAAVIDDVLGLLVLAFVSSVAKGSIDVIGIVGTTLAAVVFTFVVARYGSSAVKRVVPHVDRKLSSKESQFHFAMVVVFSLSVLSDYIGIAAIVGSFLAGLAFSEAVDRRVRDLSHGVAELLVPFFLASIGLHLNSSVFKDKTTITLALALTVMAMVTKLLGCGLPALMLGPKDALRVGIGMAPRGEVGMVVAQLGLSLGIVSASVYGAVVFMAVATTVLAPPLLRSVYAGCERPAPEGEFVIG
ncbi:MAG: cation:proton antiporter [Bryobacteraceae bacterium]